ncbi:MAG: amidohydrolase [Acetobacter sp.]|nr:amidohydrolase [Bacteroides sp.]MCM1342162.1 amidohydrolase [Acetobacter sp.]MCM1434369.1 amidohydrolase [Clostridiales bacterium]
MIRFYNGRLLTLDESKENEFEITNEEVWVDGSKICYVGNERADKNNFTFEREINLEGNLLMPSFKNAHTHSAMTFGRSFSDDLPLDKWLNEKIFPLEAKLCGDDIYKLSKIAFLEYLTSGISACFDMYYFPDDMAKASIEMRFRTVMCGAVNNFKESPELLEEYYNTYNNYHELISYKLGFHAEYTTDYSILKKIAKLAEKYKAPVYMHSSETMGETASCINSYNKTPTQLFEKLGLFNYGGGAFHSVWVDDDDLKIYKKHNIYAVINAASNAKLASGVAPVEKMISKNINLAIGTDGPSSNNGLDMFREMYLTCVLQKIKNKDAASTDADKILKAAVTGSARCMGLENCDCIKEGKMADLIVIDMHKPNMQPILNITKNLVYSGSKDNVKMTMVNGKILYENGNFTDIDIDKIYREADEVVKRIQE